LRFFDAQRRVVLAESESEKHRADALAAENERLRQELETLRQRLPQQGTP
jgi:hypothetical protein